MVAVDAKFCVSSSLVLISRKQLVEELNGDSMFMSLYHYLGLRYGLGSLNVAIFEKWSDTLLLILGLRFHHNAVFHEMNSTISPPPAILRNEHF